MDDVALIRHQLALEESRAERLDQELAEAAAIGRQLLAKNEELAQEVEFWRGRNDSDAPSGLEPELACYRDQLSRFGSADAWGDSLDSSGRDAESRLQRPGNVQGSTADLAREYESDLQELLAENRRLSVKAVSLERDNKALQERIEEVSQEQDIYDASTAASYKSERRDTIKSGDSRSMVDFAELEGREDLLKTELDEVRVRVMDLEDQLVEARRDRAQLGAQVQDLEHECQDQHSLCQAKEAQIAALQERLQELAHAVQDQRVMGSSQALSGGMASSPRSLGVYTSLERDILTASGDNGERSGADANMLRQVEELRAQLAAAEAAGRECRSLRAELALQKREADELRGQLRLTQGGDRPGDLSLAVQLSASASSSKAMAHEALMEVEELRGELQRLKQQLAAAEAGEREARDAAQRQRELSRRARQAARREAEELRQELLSAEAKALQCEAADPLEGQRELLRKIERLKAALQAETKARRYIEAELLRTLAGIRHMDTELHAC